MSESLYSAWSIIVTKLAVFVPSWKHQQLQYICCSSCTFSSASWILDFEVMTMVAWVQLPFLQMSMECVVRQTESLLAWRFSISCLNFSRSELCSSCFNLAASRGVGEAFKVAILACRASISYAEQQTLAADSLVSCQNSKQSSVRQSMGVLVRSVSTFLELMMAQSIFPVLSCNKSKESNK